MKSASFPAPGNAYALEGSIAGILIDALDVETAVRQRCEMLFPMYRLPCATFVLSCAGGKSRLTG